MIFFFPLVIYYLTVSICFFFFIQNNIIRMLFRALLLLFHISLWTPLLYVFINDDVCGVEWSSQMIKKEEVVLYFHYLYSSLFLDYLFVCVQKRIRAGKEGGYLISLYFTYKARRLKN